MILAFLSLTWPTFASGLALGGVYALMAVGIGLVFGVLRLVNFAYGQLIMAGAFALAYGSQWGFPNWASILFCFGVVLGLSVLMDWLVFRPLRTQSPAVMCRKCSSTARPMPGRSSPTTHARSMFSTVSSSPAASTARTFDMPGEAPQPM